MIGRDVWKSAVSQLVSVRLGLIDCEASMVRDQSVTDGRGVYEGCICYSANGVLEHFLTEASAREQRGDLASKNSEPPQMSSNDDHQIRNRSLSTFRSHIRATDN